MPPTIRVGTILIEDRTLLTHDLTIDVIASMYAL
jgi:hypothetical protein